MAGSRSTGFATSYLLANGVQLFAFVRIDVPSPVSETIRLTSAPFNFTGSIDGGSASWVSGEIMTEPSTEQAQDTPLAISNFAIQNGLKTFAYSATLVTFSQLIMAVGNSRGWPCKIYWGMFDSSGAFQGSYIDFNGVTDAAQITSQQVQLSIVPTTSTWSQLVPRASCGSTCYNVYRGNLCQFSGAEPTDPATGLVQLTCRHTRYDCDLRSNLAHINIDDAAPRVNSILRWNNADITAQSTTTTSGTTQNVAPPGSPGTVIPLQPPVIAAISGRAVAGQAPPDEIAQQNQLSSIIAPGYDNDLPPTPTNVTGRQ